MAEGNGYESFPLGFLLDQVPALIGYIGRNLVYRSVNRGYEDMLGLPRSEIIGHRVEDVVDPEHFATAKPYLERALGGEQVAFESWIRDAQGVRRDIDVNCIPDQGADGAVAGIVVMARDITNDRRAAAVLRESELRFRNLADHAPVMIRVTEADGHCSYLNRPWYDFTGKEPDSGLGEGWLEVVHPEDRGQTQRLFAAAHRLQDPIRLDYRLGRHDGAWRWVLDVAQPRFDGESRFLGYVGTVIDITDRKRHEEALRESERFLAHLLSQVPGAVYRCRHRPTRRMDYVSPGIRALTGYQPEDFCSGRVAYDDLIHPDDRELVWRMVDQALSQYEGHECSYRLLHADGSERRIWESGRGIIEAGQPVAVEGFLMDVTGEHELQESLNRSLERTRLLNQVGILLLDAGSDLEQTLFQTAGIVASGFASLCLIDLDEGGELRRAAWAHHDQTTDLTAIGDFVPSEQGDHPIAQVLRSGRPLLVPEFTDARIESSSLSSAHASFLRSLAIRSVVVAPVVTRSEVIGVLTLCRTGVAGPVFDEQDLALCEELGRRIGLAVANARLYQTEREARELAQRRADQLASANAELEQFAYIASHDLREPMRMVTQYLDLLQRRHAGQIDAEAEGFIARAVEGALRMQDLMRDLLDYTRTGRSGTRIRTVDLQQVVDGVLLSLQPRILETAAQISVEGMPREIRGDATRLALLLQNLVDNALTFMPEGRVPVVRVEGQELPEAWRISVIDNGIGIDPRHHQRVFEVFRRLHPRDRYAGTGIGLAICRKIVEQHQGRIWVESESGVGTTMHFMLPKDPEAWPAAEPAVEDGS